MKTNKASTTIFLAAAIVALLLVPTMPAGAAVVRTESHRYMLGFVGEVAPICATNPDTGGTCYGLNYGERSVTVTIDDDEGWPVAGAYTFTDSFSRIYSYGEFCRSTTLNIPNQATRLVIYTLAQGVIDSSLNSGVALGCGLEYRPATSGLITAEFHDS